MGKLGMAILAVLFCTTSAFAASGGMAPVFTRFIDNGNGTITDQTTNLIWQQCSKGYTTTATKCDTLSGGLASAATATWGDALSYCEGLSLGGFTDWRLPTVKELQSILDLTKASGPTIDATFPNTQTTGYWSSISYVGALSAWYVNFSSGTTNFYIKSNAYPVRCVRGGQ